MMAIKRLILSFFLAFSIISCSKESSDIATPNLDPKHYYEALNISYGADKNQTFDLYLPANRSSATKVMVLIHGGGWSAGDKSEMDGIKDIMRLELPEMAIVNINYTLATADKKPYPMQINDITAVIDHLKAKKEYYVMSEDFGFLGASAGAHLALLWSYAFDEDHIKMVGSIVGPTDLSAPFYLDSPDANIKTLIDLFGINATTEFLKKVSPYYQATASSPPTILFYGGKDPLVPASQGDQMADKLQQLGVTHEYTLYENAGHGWIGPELLDTWTKFKIFTQRHLL